MEIVVRILTQNVLPIMLTIALGALLQRVFRLDIRTLSKLNLYLFSPAVMFVMLYESSPSAELVLSVVGFFALFIACLYLLAEIVARLRRHPAGLKAAMRNSILFYNSGNYGLPLNRLVFGGDALTQSIQVLMMMLQNLLTGTFGVYAVNSHRQNWKATLRTIAAMPGVYAIVAAFACRSLDFRVPDVLAIPLRDIADGFIAMALLTLGVQLGSVRWGSYAADVAISCFIRLCVGPALGFLLVWLLGIRGPVAQALVLSCAVPTSVNSVLLAVEFDNEPEFASQAVLASTVLSVVTVTAVIALLPLIP